MKIGTLAVLFGAGLMSSAALAIDIHVPADWPTIQQGIHNAVDGDRVLVDEGSYHESIDFKGKSIEVIATGLAHNTTIHAKTAGVAAVAFRGSETRAARLVGFRIEGATLSSGIVVSGEASPEVADNIIQNNAAPYGGGGIVVAGNANPWIHHNVIQHNDGGTSGQGGGILVLSSAQVLIENNRIRDNFARMGGGGLAARTWSSVTAARNDIRRNRADVGGGVYVDADSIRLADNLIAYNGANTGAGVRAVTQSPTAHHKIFNNTFVDNDHGRGAAMSSNTEDAGGWIKIANNIIVHHGAGGAVCYPGKKGHIVFGDNLIYVPGHRAIKGDCEYEGTILRLNPQFAGSGRETEQFRLSAISPAIDAGNNNAAQWFNLRDLGGDERIVNGTIDLGAFEYVGAAGVAR